MPRKSSLRCYFGCENEATLHHFPKPEYYNMERFNKWKLVLSEKDAEKKANYIYNQFRICDCHFEKIYLSASKRLIKNAVPTLNLRYVPTYEHSYCQLPNGKTDSLQHQKPANDVFAPSLHSTCEVNQETSGKAAFVSMLSTCDCSQQESDRGEPASLSSIPKRVSSRSFIQYESSQEASDNGELTLPPILSTVSRKRLRHRYGSETKSSTRQFELPSSSITRKVSGRSSILDESFGRIIKCKKKCEKGELPSLSSLKGMSRKNLKQKLCNIIPKYKRMYAAYKRTKQILKRKLQSQNISVEHNFEHLTKNMDPRAKQFFNMQINMCTNRGNGRQFSLQEKHFALSILKQSPEAYRFLQDIFILPSSTTLKQMTPELNEKESIIAEELEFIVEEVSDSDE